MRHRALWLIAGIGGGTLAVLSLGGGLFALALVLAGEGALTVAVTLPVAGGMAVGLGLGVPLALQGWAGWQARPSRPFTPSHVWRLWLAWALAIGLGTAVSLLSLAPALLLPPIHVLAMGLPPLIVLWLVGGALRGAGGSWREVVAGMSGGGFLALVGALLAEGVIALVLVALVAAVVWLTPGGAEQIASLARNLQDPAWVADLDNLGRLLLSPVVAVSSLVLFGIPVPLVEEALKTLAGGVAARWVRPRPARAFLWGVAGGAGFALAENLLNGALGGAESWPLAALARLGATVMHCATGGLVGWGWGQLWTARRPARFLASYVVAVAAHGLWNIVTVILVLLSAGTLMVEGDALWSALAGLGTVGLLGFLGLLAAASIALLPFAARRLAAERSREGVDAEGLSPARSP